MDTNEMIEAFFAFVYERQLIWHKRTILHLPAPWTEDKILQTYKFCNVYRQLDAGTLAISKYLQAEYSPEQKLFNIIAYRFFNRRNTIEHLFGGFLNPQTFNFSSYEQRFDKIKQKENIFSNAYLISSHPYNPKYRPQEKHIQILLMLNDLRIQMPNLVKDLKEHKAQEGLNIIQSYVHMAGPFLAGQILLDATYAENIVDYTANDFLVVGPGAHWGLNIIFNKKLSPREAAEKCRFLYKIQAENFEKLKQQKHKNWLDICWQNNQYPNYPYLCLHDIQNSLCEFRKYWRLLNGEKAKKRYFK